MLGPPRFDGRLVGAVGIVVEVAGPLRLALRGGLVGALRGRVQPG